MRSVASITKIEGFMAALGSKAKSPGRIYFTGGATALLHGWRGTTNDIDLKADPEPSGLFEAIATLKDQLDLNIERGHERDLFDVQSMLQYGLIAKNRLHELFHAIEPALIRYPAITPAEFRSAVDAFCAE